MKLFAVKAYGNYAGGVLIVRAESDERAREYASKWRGSSMWNIRWDRPEEVTELPPTGTGVIYDFETGE